jgi:hypothetical protein
MTYKAASVGAVRNPSFACTGRALHRIDFVSCHGLNRFGNFVCNMCARNWVVTGAGRCIER